MATARRVFWESVIFIAFLVVIAGVLFWSNGRVARHAESLEDEHSQTTSLVEERHREEIETLRQSWMSESEIRAKGQAEAVLRAFEAGVHTAAAARWGRYLDSARDGLTAHPAVSFVHLVTPGGRVITSSDETLDTSGRLDESGQWALDAEALVTRDDSDSGVFELALPIIEEGRKVAVLWMGYDLSAVTRAAAVAD